MQFAFAVDEQVVPGQLDVREGILHVVEQERTGRVRDGIEEQRLGAWRDRRLDGGRIEREVVLEAGRDMEDHPPANTIAGT